MKSLEYIKTIVSQFKIKPRPEMRSRVLNEALEIQKSLQSNSDTNLWRIIMKSSIVKIAAAVIVIIACLAGLTMFDRTSSIALADVLSHIEKSKAYMYQMSLTSTGQVVGNMIIDAEITGTVLMSKEYGAKMIMDTRNLKNEETISQQMYLVPEKKYVTIIMPTQKYYMQMELNDTFIEQFENESYDPGDTLEQILKCEYKSLGKSVKDGIEVEGFQTTDPQYCGGFFNKVDIKLWVDVKTLLPVQMEMNFQIMDCNVNGMIYDYQWDIPVNESDFEPNISSDYRDMTPPAIQN